MLIVTRRPGESVVLYTSDGPIEVCFFDFKTSQHIKIGVHAPPCVKVLRDELLSAAELQEVRNGTSHS